MIFKSANVSTQKLDSNELAKINKFTLEPLKEEDVCDAYEVSFVAVPAQVKAGTVKEFKNKYLNK